MKRLTNKSAKIQVRHNRIRAKISGTSSMPRLSVYKSNTSVYGQIIDDSKGITLAAYSADKAKGKNFVEKSLNAGKELAKLAIEKGAKSLLLPVACRKQLFDLSDDMATKLDIEFYQDARDALLKALAD